MWWLEGFRSGMGRLEILLLVYTLLCSLGGESLSEGWSEISILMQWSCPLCWCWTTSLNVSAVAYITFNASALWPHSRWNAFLLCAGVLLCFSVLGTSPRIKHGLQCATFLRSFAREVDASFVWQDFYHNLGLNWVQSNYVSRPALYCLVSQVYVGIYRFNSVLFYCSQ